MKSLATTKLSHSVFSVDANYCCQRSKTTRDSPQHQQHLATKSH